MNALVCRFLVVFTAILTLSAVAMTAQGSPRLEEWQKTLLIATNAEPQTFDPAVNVAAVSAYRFYPNVYESLIQYAPDGKLKPMLAEKWEILDGGLRYRFALVKNAKFSDGTAFDAAAVRASFDRFLGLGKGLVSAYSSIKSVEVVDTHTVDLVLKEQFAPLLAVLASWYGGIIVSPTAVRTNTASNDQAEGWLRNHTAGTGPYVLERWEPESRIVLVTNPHYRLGWKPGQVERIVYTMTREPSTMRQALVGGAVDMAEEIPPSLIAPLKTSKDVVTSINITHGSSYGQELYVNQSKAPFNNVNVRKALAYAINYDRLVTVWQGIATLADGPFPRSFRPWFASKAVVNYRYDPGRAREYLSKAGLSVPINPSIRLDIIWQSGNTAQRDMAQLIAEDWAKLGIQLNIVEAPLPVWREAIWRNTYDVAFIQLPLRYNDPDSIASLVYDSREFRYRGFNPGYRNARVDQLIQLGRTTIGSTARTVYYNELQNIVTDEVAMIHLVNKLHSFAYRREVEGIVWNPNYGPHYLAYYMRKSAK